MSITEAQPSLFTQSRETTPSKPEIPKPLQEMVPSWKSPLLEPLLLELELELEEEEEEEVAEPLALALAELEVEELELLLEGSEELEELEEGERVVWAPFMLPLRALTVVTTSDAVPVAAAL